MSPTDESKTDAAAKTAGEIPAADIPDLKKREKERKRAGSGWWFSRSGRAPFSGAVGGQGATAARSAASAASAARSAAGAAAAGIRVAAPGVGGWLAGLFETLGGWLGIVAPTLLGKVLIGLGLASLLTGAGILAYTLTHPNTPAGSAPDLGALTSSIKVRGPDYDARLGLAAQSNNGDIKFTEAAPATKPLTGPETAPKAETAPKLEMAMPGETVTSILGGSSDRMAHDLSGSRLTSSIGGSFGAKNIFASLVGAPTRFSDGFDRTRLVAFSRKSPSSGRLAGMPRTSTGRRAAPVRISRVRAGRAIGQAKFARGMSVIGAAAPTDERAAAMAAGAFDQAGVSGGELPGLIQSPAAPTAPGATSGGYGPVTPVGGLDPAVLPTPPDSPPGVNATPYQTPLNSAFAMGAMAGMLKMISIMLIAIGLVLIAIGSAIPIYGVILIAIGAALVGAGLMMLMMAGMMADMARQMGKEIASAYGQKYQEAIVDECMDQAVNDGTQPQNCDPATKPQPAPTTVQEDVRKEREAGFELESGEPVGPPPLKPGP